MDDLGQIHKLSDIIRPEIAVVTNIGISHIENLGSRENIRKAKLEIADFMGNDNTLVINQSNDLLDRSEIDGPFNVVACGEDGDDDLDYSVRLGEDKGMDGFSFYLDHDGKSRKIDMKVPGAHNMINAALAAAAAEALGMTPEEVESGLKKLELTGNRLRLRRAGKFRIIDDSYNAAPASMESAIKTLMHTKGDRKIAVLGGMNELGNKSEEAHREVGKCVAESGADMLIAVGMKTLAMVDEAKKYGMTLASWYKDGDELVADAGRIFKPGDIVLIKGSNATGLSKVADQIVENSWK